MWILLFQTMLYEYAISLTVHISPPQNIWHKNKVPQSCILRYVSVFSKLSLFWFLFSFNDPSKKQPAVTQHKHRRRRGKNSGAGRRLKKERMDDRGLVWNRMYPFVLCPGRVVLGVTARGVGEVNLHVIRHFFKKVGGDQTLVSIELPLNGKQRTSCS